MTAEMIHRYVVRDAARRPRRTWCSKVTPYRGGYLPEERREIERRLFTGELLGVSTTRGAGAGHRRRRAGCQHHRRLPGHARRFFQQAGRAGRRDRGRAGGAGRAGHGRQPVRDEPPGVHLRPARSSRRCIDPDNPFVITGHLRCAAHELPLAEAEVPLFGPHARAGAGGAAGEPASCSTSTTAGITPPTETPQHEVGLRSYADAERGHRGRRHRRRDRRGEQVRRPADPPPRGDLHAPGRHLPRARRSTWSGTSRA